MFHVKRPGTDSDSISFDRPTLGELLLTAARPWGLEFNDEQIAKCLDYTECALQARSLLNLTAITSPDEFILKQVVDSLACFRCDGVRRASRLVDVGSGGGFPAVAIALALPHASVTALESRKRKAEFIGQAAAQCGIHNINVVAERAEDAGRGQYRDAFDAAVCRALAKPAVALELCLPLVRTGGILVALCGHEAACDADGLEPVAMQLGGGSPHGQLYRLPVLAHRRGLIECRKKSGTPTRFPRRPGMASKRPLMDCHRQSTVRGFVDA